jgi:hypothetical protein
MTRASVHQIATAALRGIPPHLLLPAAHLTLQIMAGTQTISVPAAGHLLGELQQMEQIQQLQEVRRVQVVVGVKRPSAHASTKDCRFQAQFTMTSQMRHQETVWLELIARNIQACTKT